MTTRGCKESDMDDIAELVVKAAQVAQRVVCSCAKAEREGREDPKKLHEEFDARIEEAPEIAELRLKVHQLATKFDMPGFETESMKYRDVEGPERC